MGGRAGEGDEGGIFFGFFKIEWVNRDGFGGAKDDAGIGEIEKERKKDGVDQIDVGQRVQGEALGQAGRRVAELVSDEAVGDFVEDDRIN